MWLLKALCSVQIWRIRRRIARCRWASALELLARIWLALVSVRRSAFPLELYERDALRLYIECFAGLRQFDELLSCCRTARRMGFLEKEFFDWPCTIVLGRNPSSAGVDEIRDLVDWVLWHGPGYNGAESARVEKYLRRALWPGRTEIDINVQQELLVELETFWTWTVLYRAEIARREKSWRNAAAMLKVAAHQESQPETKADLLWRAAHCLALDGDEGAAYTVSLEAYRIHPPQSLPAWRLSGRLAVVTQSLDMARTILIDALAQHPEDCELLHLLQRLCLETGDWKGIGRVAGKALSGSSESSQKSAALVLWCRAVIAERKPKTAAQLGRRIIDIVETGSRLDEPLAAFAATVVYDTRAADVKSQLEMLQSLDIGPGANAQIAILRSRLAVLGSDP